MTDFQASAPAHSTPSALTLILAVGGELLLESSQFGKRRIGVDRTLALTRRRGRRKLPVRRPAVGAFVTSVLVAAALVAPTAKFALVPPLALHALPRRTALVLARLARRRAIGSGSGSGFRRRIGAGVAEFIAAVAPSAPGPLALCA